MDDAGSTAEKGEDTFVYFRFRIPLVALFFVGRNTLERGLSSYSGNKDLLLLSGKARGRAFFQRGFDSQRISDHSRVQHSVPWNAVRD